MCASWNIADRELEERNQEALRSRDRLVAPLEEYPEFDGRAPFVPGEHCALHGHLPGFTDPLTCISCGATLEGPV